MLFALRNKTKQRKESIMKRSLLSLISLLLALLMLGSMLASCKPSGDGESTTSGKSETQNGTEKQEQTDTETPSNVPV